MKHLATWWEYERDKTAPVMGEEEITISRQTVKVILFNDQGEIALTYYPPSKDYPNDEYYLPGGGVEEGEDEETALRREVIEEVGCEIKEIEELGQIVEYWTKDPRKNILSCYKAKVEGEIKELQLTEKEVLRNQSIMWFSPTIAIEKVNLNHESMAKDRALLLLKLATENI